MVISIILYGLCRTLVVTWRPGLWSSSGIPAVMFRSRMVPNIDSTHSIHYRVFNHAHAGSRAMCNQTRGSLGGAVVVGR